MKDIKISKEPYTLPIIPQHVAIKKANEKIYEYMTTENLGLKSRWNKLDEGMGGAWYFEQITNISSSSGSGKSMFLNLLRSDFVNKKINEKLADNIKVLTFTFEMSAVDELIRSYGAKLKTSYSELISAYKKITKERYAFIEDQSKYLNNKNLFYVEASGNTKVMMDTVDKFINKFPNSKLIIMLDHSLLVKYLSEKSEVELMVSVARFALDLKKKYKAMVILLSQLNSDIERSERITNPILQYPIKSDLFSSKQIFHIVDNQIIIHRPELLQISEYGINRFPTDKLVAMHIIKSRFAGKLGVIRFRQDFDHSNLIYPYDKKFKIK